MSYRFVQGLFNPKSIAVIGASNTPRKVGHVVMRNLLAGGFTGAIMPVNPRYESAAGVLCYPDVAHLPRTPDLAIICTRPKTVPELIDQLGVLGTRAVIVMAGDLETTLGADGQPIAAAMLAAAKRYGVRVLGGGTLGVIVPALGLNATFSNLAVRPGPIGFVSQSDAVGTLVLDWAASRKVGFSHFVSLGEGSDIGLGEVLDFLGSDPDTKAILLYLEAVRDRPTFMAAARAAARNKPVIAIKAGRVPHDPLVGISDPLFLDTSSLISSDDVYDAALRRAGILRVNQIEELFAAVETVARSRPINGERLVVVSNGGGAGGMVEDILHLAGYPMPRLAERSVARLKMLLPHWNGKNPIDVRVGAPPKRYAEVLEILGDEGEGDAVLVIHTPAATVSSAETAQALVEGAKGLAAGRLLTCWVGDESVAAERHRFVEAKIPTFDTPGLAAQAFLHMLRHRRNQEALIQVPPSIPEEFAPDTERVRAIIRQALQGGQTRLDEAAAKAVLTAYGIPVVETHFAATPEAAAELARAVGLPVALTIASPDLRSKWEVGGVALNLETAEGVQAAARGMAERLREYKPAARLDGFNVQRMVPRRHARQLVVGVATDRLFGPVILFGEGGRAVELYRDLAVGLPPLNLLLARDLIGRTRAAALLRAHHDHPAADADAIALTLVKVAQLVVDHPEIVELDINPLFADEHGVIALDGHLRLSAEPPRDAHRLAIRPYPKTLEEQVVLRDGRQVVFRPIRPEDQPAHVEFIARLTPEDIRSRFFRSFERLPDSQMARLTQIDYSREMAFIASAVAADGRAETLGAVRAVADPDNHTAEFSIVVRSDLKGQGLGSRLLQKMIAYCQSRGTRVLAGEILADNEAIRGLLKAFHFRFEAGDEPGLLRVSLDLAAA